VRANLERIRAEILHAAQAAPRHEEYIAQHCRIDVRSVHGVA
jgi:hypothetical protein